MVKQIREVKSHAKDIFKHKEGEKPFWQSKTLWLNILVIIGIVMAQRPETTALMLGALNVLLRFVTKEKVIV